MSSYKSLFASVFALSFSATTVSAAPLYEQPDLNPGSDRGAYQYFGQELADDFVLSQAGTFDTLSWKGGYWGTDNTSGSESFTVHLHTTSGGLPTLTPFYNFVGNASVSPTADTRGGSTVYDFFMDVADVALGAGVTYWISIYTNDNPANYAWSPEAIQASPGAIRRNGGAWSSIGGNRGNHVFVLNPSFESNSVPVPGALALLGCGLISLGMRRRTA